MQKETEPSPQNPQDIYDLTGRTHGPITVLKLDHITKGRRYWLTRCVCGTERVLTTHHFRKEPPYCEECELIELRASGEASPKWMLDLGFDETFLIRFWPRVNKDGPVPAHMPHLGPCWIWTGGVNGNGYGSIMARHDSKIRLTSTHQASWAIANRKLPDLCVLHHCDTPRCCRPDHLFLGTKGENNADRVSKGRDRHPVGEDHTNSKLTNADVLAIRELRRLHRITYSDLAARFKCSQTLIAVIVRGEHWKHLL